MSVQLLNAPGDRQASFEGVTAAAPKPERPPRRSTNPAESQLAVVIGGSRGIGAASAQALARRGCEVMLTYRTRRQRAVNLTQEIQAAGGAAEAVQLEACDAASRRALVEQIAAAGRRVDYLILCASGGLEPGAPSTYAEDLNSHAPAALACAFRPLMRAGGSVVYVTSHEAHINGDHSRHPAYAVIARTKKAGERRLVDQERRLPGAAVLKIVSADIVEGTATAKLLERWDADLIEAHRRQSGGLPTPGDVAEEIVRRCHDDSRPGAVSYVWSPGDRYRGEVAFDGGDAERRALTALIMRLAKARGVGELTGGELLKLPLFSSKLLESLQFLELLGFVEAAVGHPLDEQDLVVENFDSLERIAALIDDRRAPPRR